MTKLTPEQTEQAAKALRPVIGYDDCICESCVGRTREKLKLLQKKLAKVGLAIMPSNSVERLLSACKTAVECCEREPTRQEYEHMFIELKTAIAESPALQPIEKEEK